jgi:hypothetical protein
MNDCAHNDLDKRVEILEKQMKDLLDEINSECRRILPEEDIKEVKNKFTDRSVMRKDTSYGHRLFLKILALHFYSVAPAFGGPKSLREKT